MVLVPAGRKVGGGGDAAEAAGESRRCALRFRGFEAGDDPASPRRQSLKGVEDLGTPEPFEIQISH